MKRSLLVIGSLLIGAVALMAQIQAPTFVLFTAGPCRDTAGTASPEGAKTGNPCDVYRQIASGTSGHLWVKTTGTGNTGWLDVTDGGAGGAVTPSTTDTFTNKTIDAEGTGNLITIPEIKSFAIAVCQNATASLGVSTPTSNPAVAACVTGSNTQLGVAQFADGASSLSIQGHFTLPSDWTGAIDLKGLWRTAATSGDVKWQIATICVADAETADPAFNTASTVTETAKGTTLQLNAFTVSSITVTGCTAGEELFWKFFRDPADGSDTLAATAEIVSVLQFIVRRAM